MSSSLSGASLDDELVDGHQTKATLEMQARWLATLKRTAVPQVDLSAQSRLLSDEKTTRQFWPEFSQSAYDATFKAQEVFGDYTDPSLAKQGKLRVKSK